MDNVLIIGLPKQARRKVEAEAQRNDVNIVSILIDRGVERSFKFVPDPKDAEYKIDAYFDSISDPKEGLVIVLPYCMLTQEMQDQLDALADLEAEITYIDAGTVGWPAMPSKKVKPDENFYNEVARSVIDEIFEEYDEDLSLADYLTDLSHKNPNFIVAKKALETCDQVAAHRHDFVRKTGTAFVDMVRRVGKVGPYDSYFKALGLDFASTGGMTTTLTVYKQEIKVQENQSNFHVKQGDATTPQAAARAYFQTFEYEAAFFLVLLYVGIHPDDDSKCDRTVYL